MKNLLISILRDKNTNTATFRKTTEKLAAILAGEALNLLPKKEFKIETPINSAQGTKLKNDIVFIPILRSGIALMTTFLQFFENAAVGFVGMKRDEITAIPHLYYKNLPKTINQSTDIIVLDPMIATGGSGTAALRILKECGIKDEKIIFVAIIASQDGINTIKSEFPKIRFVIAQIDNKLTSKKFIDPGLGDFGDRFFVTE